MTIFEDFVAFPEYFLWWSVKFYKSRILSIAQKGILERQQNLQKTSKNLIFQKTFWESNHHVSSQKVTKSSQNLIFQKTFWESNCIEQMWWSVKFFLSLSPLLSPPPYCPFNEYGCTPTSKSYWRLFLMNCQT